MFKSLKDLLNQNMDWSTNMKERPRCRKVIMNILREKNLTLKELWDNRHELDFHLSDNMKKQLRKMMMENVFKLGRHKSKKVK